METEWRVARAHVRDLVQDKPQASHRELADQLGYSMGWVRKWRKRLKQAAPDDDQILLSQSHCPKQMVRRVSAPMEERIIALRIRLSDHYHRQVGSRTIAAYLKRGGPLENGVAPPSSTTIWRVLHRRQYILGKRRPDRQPLVRPEPGIHWEIDFCTAARQSPEAPQKKENALEVLRVVDRGSSANIDSQASTQFDAEEALRSLATTLQQQGLPRAVTYDRDPRFVGNQATDGFPSAFTRFLLCLGCTVDILPPQRPDLKPYVERFQRTLKTECLDKHHPTTATETNAVLLPYRQWFNQERPHQGRDLHDQPPQHLLAQGPFRQRLPETVDPDAWLTAYHNRAYRRHVDSRGIIQLWKHTYYVGQNYLHRTVLVRLDALQRLIHIEAGRQPVRTVPLQGLVGRPLDYPDFLGFMCDEARSEWQTHLWQQRLKASMRFSAAQSQTAN